MVGGLVEKMTLLVLEFIKVMGGKGEVVGLCTGMDDGSVGSLVGDEALGKEGGERKGGRGGRDENGFGK